MEPKEIQEALAYAPTGALKALADRCLQDDVEVEVVSPPLPSLVMARVTEKVDGEVFNLGEVLTTTCEVRLGGETGWAMVMDDDPERALCAAIVDAASRREGVGREGVGRQGVGREGVGIRAELEGLLADARAARRARWENVQPTRVAFEEMA